MVVSATVDILEEKIRSRRARVGIVGLGYVGLPLAVEFAKAGFPVTGIDVNTQKVERVNAGDSYVGDISSDALSALVKDGKLRATTDFGVVGELDTVNICVPTPLRKTKDPDMSYIVSSCQEIANNFHAGMLIILESTTYPGTTAELLLPVFEKSGLRVGEDFFLCFSPERVDPGNAKYQTRNIPKVVGGITAACTRMGSLFYSQALATVVPVSSTQVAEMVKLLENTFRMINIGLVNEMALMCDRIGRQRLGGDRGGRHQAVRFHAVLSRPGAGRPLHPDRPVLSFMEDQAGGDRGALHRTGRLHQRPDAALCGGQSPERAQRRGQAGEGYAHSHPGRRI